MLEERQTRAAVLLRSLTHIHHTEMYTHNCAHVHTLTCLPVLCLFGWCRLDVPLKSRATNQGLDPMRFRSLGVRAGVCVSLFMRARVWLGALTDDRVLLLCYPWAPVMSLFLHRQIKGIVCSKKLDADLFRQTVKEHTHTHTLLGVTQASGCASNQAISSILLLRKQVIRSC